MIIVMWTNEGKHIRVKYGKHVVYLRLESWEDELKNLLLFNTETKSKIEDCINDLLCESLWENED